MSRHPRHAVCWETTHKARAARFLVGRLKHEPFFFLGGGGERRHATLGKLGF